MASAFDVMMDVDSVSAARRRERRLRQFLRHERLSVAMAPVREEAPHLEGSEEGQGREVGTRSTTRRSSGPTHSQPELFQFLRKSPAVPGHPVWVSRGHTVEQLADVVPMVQILDIPVPQVVGQSMDVAKHIDIGVAERVIEVPKISCPPCPLRASLVTTQKEQLVEAPIAESLVLACGRDAAGVTWCQVAQRQGTEWEVYWWRADTRRVQWTAPEGFTASPGRCISTGQG